MNKLIEKMFDEFDELTNMPPDRLYNDEKEPENIAVAKALSEAWKLDMENVKSFFRSHLPALLQAVGEEIIGEDEKIITRKAEDFQNIKHNWVLDSVKNDTGQTKVYYCKCGARKEGNTIYFSSCDGDIYSEKPCICNKAEMERIHLNPVDSELLVIKKTTINEEKTKQRSRLKEVISEIQK